MAASRTFGLVRKATAGGLLASLWCAFPGCGGDVDAICRAARECSGAAVDVGDCRRQIEHYQKEAEAASCGRQHEDWLSCWAGSMVCEDSDETDYLSSRGCECAYDDYTDCMYGTRYYGSGSGCETCGEHLAGDHSGGEMCCSSVELWKAIQRCACDGPCGVYCFDAPCDLVATSEECEMCYEAESGPCAVEVAACAADI